MKEKKTNSYKRALKIMAVGGVLGGISGGLCAAAKTHGIGLYLTEITVLIQSAVSYTHLDVYKRQGPRKHCK